MAKLEGKVIAITGPRKAKEMSILIEKQGGIPLVRQAQGTMFEGFEHLESEVDKLIHQPLDWAVWTTGMGVNKLVEAAELSGKKEALLAKLAAAKHAARGYKTVNALRKLGLTPEARDDDGSTLGLIRGLQALNMDWNGLHVSLQLHGDPAPKLVGFMEEAGAVCLELMPYRHIPPSREDLQVLLDELLSSRIDAVALTSAPQARFLFEYAKEEGLDHALREVFQNRTLAAAVGRVTAAALLDEGVERILVPEEERMGALIVTLARWYDQQAEA
ncbi:uroporphyrinogen-III synthase [Paenibacillus aquistagni]|uniref:uroporphyrinogen-III synthase n=1 Tax=Paenibacillus aquistagni TaxID=1852522 RepID=UPI00145B2A34|nr:uroporphyrinogen-III synthase [Paenibacillus aquistagni]NMM54037.1 uroporphyrinogen-III synthase [Paenibacillus aquistagni]